MKKYIIALALLFVTATSFAQKPPYSETQQRRRTLLRELSVGSSDIVFLGNSITQGGEWAELFGNKNVKNRGISGDRIEWMFDRVDYLIAAKPKKLFLMIGINDINGGRKVEAVVADIERMLKMWQDGSPRTKIYVQSILPQNDDIREKARPHMASVPRANEMLKGICESLGITYIDLHPVLADENGKLNPKYTLDGLHLTGEGYLRWADHIRKYVK